MRRRLLAIGLVLLLLIGSVALAYAALRVELPPPSGPYAVGRAQRHVVDADRADALLGAPAREIVVTVHYPARADGEASAYVSGALADALDEELGAFRLVPGIWSRVRSHAHDDAPVAGGPHPLLVFSPGLDVHPQLYSALLVDLASHGYVVASIAHPGSTPAVPMPDGRVVRMTPRGALEGLGPGQGEDVRALVLDVWAQDMRSAIDAMLEDASLASAIDPTRIAAIGHSFGGSAALEAARQDARFRAAVDLDGTPLAPVNATPLAFPALLAQDPPPTEAELARFGMTPAMLAASPDQRAREHVLRNATPGYRLTLEGLGHMSFASDLLAFSAKVPGGLDDMGTMDAARAERILADHVLAFLARHLRGQEAPLLEGVDAPPEARLEKGTA